MRKNMQFCTKPHWAQKKKKKSSMDNACQGILRFILHEALKNMVPLNWPIIMIGPNNNI
jgi:hypothetical protein